MTDDDVDRNRRHFLTVATAVTGGVGIALASIPFLASLKPSARALALGAPVEVPLSSLEPGEMVKVIWRGTLVYVLRRTPQMLASLDETTSLLRDPNSEELSQQPEYANNEYRSRKPGILVVEGVCTHLGCAPLLQAEVNPSADWYGGFFCPCHGSRYDLAGRVYKGVPAPLNLLVPPYRYSQDDVILIGADTEAA